MFDRKIHDSLINQNENQLFYKNLAEHSLDFKDLLEKQALKVKGDFRIRRIKELVEIEYGTDFAQKGEIGRVCVINHPKKNAAKGAKGGKGPESADEQQFLYEGELKMRTDGLHCIDGFGRYIYQGHCAVGKFKNHNLHGMAKVVRSDGTTREGIFHKNVMHGPGKVTQSDGCILEGEFQNGKLTGLGRITKKDGKIMEG